jgi:hypothetical protein
MSELTSNERVRLLAELRDAQRGLRLDSDLLRAEIVGRAIHFLEGAGHEPTSALEPDAVVVNDNQPHWKGIFETQPNVTLPVGTRLVCIEKAQAWELMAKGRGKVIAEYERSSPPPGVWRVGDWFEWNAYKGVIAEEPHAFVRFEDGVRMRLPIRDLKAASAPTKPVSRDLIDYGYAPGSYSGKCRVCGVMMDTVDKRCHCCKECAEKARDRATAGECDAQ